jgi:hypothetical protein
MSRRNNLPPLPIPPLPIPPIRDPSNVAAEAPLLSTRRPGSLAPLTGLSPQPLQPNESFPVTDINLSSARRYNSLEPLAQQNNATNSNVPTTSEFVAKNDEVAQTKKTITELVRSSIREEDISNYILKIRDFSSKEINTQLLFELAIKNYFKLMFNFLNSNAKFLSQSETDDNGNTFLHIFFDNVSLEWLLDHHVSFFIRIPRLDYRLYLIKNNSGDTPLHVLQKNLVRQGAFDNLNQREIENWFGLKNIIFPNIDAFDYDQKRTYVLKDKFSETMLEKLLHLDFKVKEGYEYEKSEEFAFVEDVIELFLFHITNNDGKTIFDLSDKKALVCAPLTTLQIALEQKLCKYVYTQMFSRLIEEIPQRVIIPNILGITPMQFFIDLCATNDCVINNRESLHQIPLLYDALVKNGAVIDVQSRNKILNLYSDQNKTQIYMYFFPFHKGLYNYSAVPIFYRDFMVDFLKFRNHPNPWGEVQFDISLYPDIYLKQEKEKEMAQLHKEYYTECLNILYHENDVFGVKAKQNNHVPREFLALQEADIRTIQRILEEFDLKKFDLENYGILHLNIHNNEAVINHLNAHDRFPFKTFKIQNDRIHIFDKNEIDLFAHQIDEYIEEQKNEVDGKISDNDQPLFDRLSERYKIIFDITQKICKLLIKDRIDHFRERFQLFFDPIKGFDLIRTDAPVVPYRNAVTKMMVYNQEEQWTPLEQVLETIDRFKKNKTSSVTNTLFIHLLIEFAHKIILTMSEQNTLLHILEERCIETSEQSIVTLLVDIVTKYQEESHNQLNARCMGARYGALKEALYNRNINEIGLHDHIMSYVSTTTETPLSNEDLAYFNFDVRRQDGGRLTKKSRNKKRKTVKSKKQLKKSKRQRKRSNHKSKARHR